MSRIFSLRNNVAKPAAESPAPPAKPAVPVERPVASTPLVMKGNILEVHNLPLQYRVATDYFDWHNKARLQKGQFGIVYETQCIRTYTGLRGRVIEAGQRYALKVIPKSRVDSKRSAKLIAHEIEIASRMDHKHIVIHYDAFHFDEYLTIVMELVKDGELFDYLIVCKRLKEAEAANIAFQLLDVLRYLHSVVQVVHRDLKPENVLLNRETMQIKLIDFGYAKFFGQGDLKTPVPYISNRKLLTELIEMKERQHSLPKPAEDSIISFTPIAGTMKYQPPESLIHMKTDGFKPRDTTRDDIQKLDIFAAGVVVYLMLGGVFPFAGSNVDSLVGHIERGVNFSDSSFRGVSADARDFCSKLLASKNSDRPLAAEALRHKWLALASTDSPDNSPVTAEFTPDCIKEARAKMERLFVEMRKEDTKLDKQLSNKTPTTESTSGFSSVEGSKADLESSASQDPTEATRISQPPALQTQTANHETVQPPQSVTELIQPPKGSA